ncbi:uncharacterized protein DNG_05286 [Cephalotrichum gorgonifer]|uniref:Uncharacterized protein n=1 Tax=Cephalotrichum gorgonifer TaxID=2041049 RepID=A0AAE8MZN0_9PEZI|nr:uncharacterized protein DNG_05286 [Cephalotrichum gorgonifer]
MNLLVIYDQLMKSITLEAMVP